MSASNVIPFSSSASAQHVMTARSAQGGRRGRLIVLPRPAGSRPPSNPWRAFKRWLRGVIARLEGRDDLPR